jgi:hypothetical protein
MPEKNLTGRTAIVTGGGGKGAYKPCNDQSGT